MHQMICRDFSFLYLTCQWLIIRPNQGKTVDYKIIPISAWLVSTRLQLCATLLVYEKSLQFLFLFFKCKMRKNFKCNDHPWKAMLSYQTKELSHLKYVVLTNLLTKMEQENRCFNVCAKLHIISTLKNTFLLQSLWKKLETTKK